MVTKTITIILIGIGAIILALFARKELNAKVKKGRIIAICISLIILALLLVYAIEILYIFRTSRIIRI